jgi:hypothetical protein
MAASCARLRLRQSTTRRKAVAAYRSLQSAIGLAREIRLKIQWAVVADAGEQLGGLYRWKELYRRRTAAIPLFKPLSS